MRYILTPSAFAGARTPGLRLLASARGSTPRHSLVVGGHDVQLVVTVGDGQDFSDYDARVVYQGMAQGLMQTAATRVELAGLRPIPSDVGEGSGATLTFLAPDGTTNYWRLATFTTDNVIVNVQALTFAPELGAEARAAVDDRFDRLVKSIVIP